MLWRRLVASAVGLTLWLGAAPAVGADVPGRWDLFQADVAETRFDLRAQLASPAGVFGSGSDRFEGTVAFAGAPLERPARHGIGPVRPGLEHFKCYGARALTRFRARNVRLEDQFWSARARVLRPVGLCNPVRIDGEPLRNRAAHLRCHVIAADGFRPREVRVRDRFGVADVRVRGPESLCLPTLSQRLRRPRQKPRFDRDAMLTDAFACYRVQPRRLRRHVTLGDQFGAERVLVLERARLCAPVRTNAYRVADSIAHLACYRIRAARSRSVRATVRTRGRFGTGTLLVLRARELCAPATKQPLELPPPPPPPPPDEPRPTPTPTPTPTGNRAPELAPIGDRTLQLGSRLSFTLSADDPDGDPIAFGASPLPLPANAALHARTGEFSFKPDQAQVGSLTIKFLASDGRGGTDIETVTITVAGPEPGGVTTLAGRLLDTNDFVRGKETPVVGATVSLLGTGSVTTSDERGAFKLTDVASGNQVLDIDTATADEAPDGSPYAGFREKLGLIEGVTNDVDRPFFLPRIASESLTRVDPAETTVVTNPSLDVSMTVPPATAKGPDGSNFTGELSISEVPKALAPAALPSELEPGLLITIQPVGVTFSTPVPITFPNTDDLPAGSELDIWSLDPKKGIFVMVGKGRVTADGSSIETIEGGIRAADWHMALPPSPGGDDDNPDHNEENQDPNRGKCPACSGDDTGVSPQRGDLTRDPALPSYRSQGVDRTVELIYNSLGADPRPVIPFDATIRVWGAVPPTLSYSLELGGIEQGGEVFVDTSGLSEEIDETIRGAVQLDATGLPTGRYPYTLRLTSNYAESRISSTVRGDVLVTNERTSPFGVGWTLKGLQRLHRTLDGAAVITQGDGSVLAFEREPGPELLEDDFDPENGGFGQLSYTGFANWDVLDGEVDLVGNGFFDFLPGNGLYVDLVGTLAGTVASKQTFTLESGEYELEFDLAGSQRGDVNSVTVTLGGVYGETFTMGSQDPLTRIERTIRVASSTRARLEFDHAEPADTFGLFLDNVTLRRREDLPRFRTPRGDFSTLVRNADGTFTRTLKDGTRITFDGAGRHGSTVDRQGNTTTYVYDADGRLQRITDPRGLATDLSYADGLLSSVTDPAGRTTTFSHDARGDLRKLTYPDGATESFAYDGQHRFTEDVNERGQIRRYEYDFAGRFRRSRLPDGSTRVATPSQEVGLIDPASGDGTESDPAPAVRPDDAVAVLVDGRGAATRLRTDALGNITSQVDPLGRRTTTTRDADGNPTRITRPNGAVTTVRWDGRGNLLSSTDEGMPGLADPAFPATTSFTYEPLFDQVTSITDPNGNTTSIGHDSRGSPVSAVDAKGTRMTLQYEEPTCPGLPTSVTAAAGLAEESTTRFTYDPRTCNLAATTDPLGNTSRVAYDTAGNAIRTTDAEGRVTRFAYDVMNRLVRVVDATSAAPEPACGSSGATCYEYHATGNLAQVTDARGGITRFEYDPLGRGSRIVDPLGEGKTFSYDPNGNVSSTRDRDGQTIEFAYDAAGRLVKKALRSGTASEEIASYGYDEVGNLIAAVDQDSALQMTYDAAGRLRSSSTAGSPSQPDTVVTYRHDRNGNRVAMSDSTGTTAYGYDALNRPTTITRGSGQPVVETITVPVDGTSVTSTTTLEAGVPYVVTASGTFDIGGPGDGLADAEYADFSDPPASLLDSFAGVDLGIAIDDTVLDAEKRPRWGAFDPSHVYTVELVGTGDPISINYHDCDGCYFNNSGSLSLEIRRADASGPDAQTARFDHDALGRRTATTLPSGVATAQSYDAAGRLRSLVNRRNGAVVSSFSYAYDRVGNVTRLDQVRPAVDVHPTLNYSYDRRDQLLEATRALRGAPGETFEHDAVGGRLRRDGETTRATFDAANRLLQDQENCYRYDARGNLVSKEPRAGEDCNGTGARTRYTYDPEDRLVEARIDDMPVVSYAYDALGRRIETRIGQRVVRYVYDRDDVLLEFDGANTVTARRSHGLGTDEPWMLERDFQADGVFGSEDRLLYLTDGLGSIQELVGAGGVKQAYVYDSFGAITAATCDTRSIVGADAVRAALGDSSVCVENSRAHAGREFDPETGLSHLRARYYDPLTGRFLAADPSVDPSPAPWSVSPYIYTENNPITRVDPFGDVQTTSSGFKPIIGPISTLLDMAANLYKCCGVGVDCSAPDACAGPNPAPVPDDPVDVACAQHDRCLKESGGQFFDVRNARVRNCHRDLCRNAGIAQAHTRTESQSAATTTLLAVFCVLSLAEPYRFDLVPYPTLAIPKRWGL